MILTQCPVCAAQLPPLSAKQCSRCKTRYCGLACQKQHWEEGGHDKLCRKIRKGGGAEQYNADQKCKDAIATAVEACAEDTKGQTCYICTQALHWKTKEGLVRGCSCRGTAGVAHVSCLAEQAKILYDEVVENKLDDKVRTERWHRWCDCSLCKQQYHGVVRCALGWACWKTYVGRPETGPTRTMAMSQLGNGLSAGKQYEDELTVREAELAMLRRIGTTEHNMLNVQSNLANSYGKMGRLEQALRMRKDIYSANLRLHGEESEETLAAGNNYASSLLQGLRFEEAKSLMRRLVPIARRFFGNSHEITFKMRITYAATMYNCGTLEDLREAVETFVETERTARRVLGSAHPVVAECEAALRETRAALAAREAP